MTTSSTPSSSPRTTPRASAGSGCAPPARPPWRHGRRRLRRPAAASGGKTAAPGVAGRRLDHVNSLAQDVPPNGDFVRDVLGGRVPEQIMLDDGTISGQWLHFTNKGYDLVYTRDWTGSTGRLHH